MTDFTPGPWQWSPWLKNGGKFLRHPGSDGYLPEGILYISRPSQPTDANANLIAAAPQLYEALETVVKRFGTNIPEWLEAEAALAAARGDAC